MSWSQLVFLVPITKDELDSARSSVLKQLDSSKDSWILKRLGNDECSSFMHSLKTDEGYTFDGVDDADKIFGKVYWWSYGYGFEDVLIYSVGEEIHRSNQSVFYLSQQDRQGHSNIPYKEVARLIIFNWSESNFEAAKTYNSFLKAYRKEIRKLFAVSKHKFAGKSRYDLRTTSEAFATLKNLFEKYPDGIVFFV